MHVGENETTEAEPKRSGIFFGGGEGGRGGLGGYNVG